MTLTVEAPVASLNIAERMRLQAELRPYAKAVIEPDRHHPISGQRAYTHLTFAQLDRRIDRCASGLEAIERLSLKPFDLVVLDLNMPDIGGVEVVEFIRGQDQLKELPILIVTTRGDEASRTRVLAAGASRFMTKPFTPDAILETVLELLEARQDGGREEP